jgi:hypothetical protein
MPNLMRLEGSNCMAPLPHELLRDTHPGMSVAVAICSSGFSTWEWLQLCAISWANPLG